jgi:hypothetical protein
MRSGYYLQTCVTIVFDLPVKKSIYILHYLLLILGACYLNNSNFQKSSHKHLKCYVSPAPGIRGVDNSNDKVQLSVFKRKASHNKTIAFKTSAKPKIKVRYNGGSCKYHLNQSPLVLGVAPFNADVSSAYSFSFSNLRFYSTLNLRGPPSILC